MKKIIILFTLFIAFNGIAQEMKVKTIYVLGGIASTHTKEDIAFEKKYNVKFYDFGCIAPLNFEEYEDKNRHVFNYLKNNFGTQWQTEIKKSAMGFKKWLNP